MKFRVLGAVLALVLVLACGFTVSGESSAPTDNSALSAEEEYAVILTARIENMLSHNFVYNDDFDSTTAMVDNAMLALIDKADEDGFIDSALVEGFVYNMYGITLDQYAVCADFPIKERYLYTIPRGFDKYSHEITATCEEDNYLHIDSVLTVTSHDGSSGVYNCRTMLEKSEASSFGYVIVSSLYY